MMPSDLTNTSVTFKSIMNEFFRIHLKRFILAFFFNDILVYSQSLDDHLKHLKVVFELLITHQLVAKVSRCVFYSGKVEYSSHIVS